MTVTRRRVLHSVAAGTAVALGQTAAGLSAEEEAVFVHPADGLGELVDAIELLDGEIRLEYENFDFVAASVPVESVEELGGLPSVASVEVDEPIEIPTGWSPTLPDVLDPGGGDCSTHSEQEIPWNVERIGADQVDGTGSGVDVGILDTGIETDHCSLEVAGGENVTALGTPGDYEDRHGHGTHVAGTVGATDNDYGVVGVAPESNLYAVKVLDDTGSGRYSDLVAGIDWCMEHEIEIISMSLGGESRSETVDQAVTAAYDAGHLLLSAAGNEENEGDGRCEEETMTYPATHEDVLAVAAMDQDDTLASYSSVGSAIDLIAPGSDVPSTTTSNEYAEASGTSMACPAVTGVAALVWESRTADDTPNEAVWERLTETAEPVLETCEEGHGLVDARAALEEDATGGPFAPLLSALQWVIRAIVGVFRWIGRVIRRILGWLTSLAG